MTDIDKAVIARLKQGDENFEILVDCDNAILCKERKLDLDDALVSNDIYKDVKKGEHASEHEMDRLFGTTDKRKVAEIIIHKGEIQLTTEHKRRLRDERKRKIVYLIQRNAINPQTNLPHPPQRIESAIDESRVTIDEFKSAESQVDHILDKIRPILPIRFETRELMLNIPAKFASAAYHTLKEYGKVIRDDWQNDGSLMVILEMPAGVQPDFEDKINKMTHGEIEINIIKKK